MTTEKEQQLVDAVHGLQEAVDKQNGELRVVQDELVTVEHATERRIRKKQQQMFVFGGCSLLVILFVIGVGFAVIASQRSQLQEFGRIFCQSYYDVSNPEPAPSTARGASSLKTFTETYNRLNAEVGCPQGARPAYPFQASPVVPSPTATPSVEPTKTPAATSGSPRTP